MDEEYNRQPQCLKCSTCIGMILSVACTVSHDTVCNCPNGYVRTIENLCRPVQRGKSTESVINRLQSTVLLCVLFLPSILKFSLVDCSRIELL